MNKNKWCLSNPTNPALQWKSMKSMTHFMKWYSLTLVVVLRKSIWPGRLNQTSVLIQREGVYYGQCSEITQASLNRSK